MLNDLRVTVLSREPSAAYDGQDAARLRVAFTDDLLKSVAIDFTIDFLGRHERGQDLAQAAVGILSERLGVTLGQVALGYRDPIAIDE
nr:hypothetical protein [uncultured Brevundimonas sp.]